MAALSIPDSSHASDAGLKTQVTYLFRRSEQELAEVFAEPCVDHLLRGAGGCSLYSRQFTCLGCRA